MQILKLISIIALACACTAFVKQSTPTPTSVGEQLEGVYEFASEETILTKPDVAKTTRVAPDWQGMWMFQHGYYSMLMTKSGRGAMFNEKGRFANAAFAYAGTYEVVDGKLVLHQEHAISLMEENRSVTMEYSNSKDSLVLTHYLHPYVEDIREGKVVTVLKRIR
jgi:hypothetical protein